MTDDVMEMRFGKCTVRENLARAVAANKLTILPDGRYVLSARGTSHSYLHVKAARKMDCGFLGDFLFGHAYDKSAVPFGCRNCYKVKIIPRSFRGLMALRTILEQAPYQSKCGADFYNPHSRDIYAGFLYLEGLGEARAAYKDMRARLDAHPDLGCDVALTIKRGCSNMEAACGPSDQWVICDEMQALERDLRERVVLEPSASDPYPVRKITSLSVWIQLAYSIGDDSYLDFTGGKPLHTPTVSYPAEQFEDEHAS